LPMLERPCADRIHVIFSGWGKDLETLRDTARYLPVTFLPCAITKQALYDLNQAADLVIDQFTFGDYGTAAQEAMAGGTPVMIWLDWERFLTNGVSAPPLINCQTATEIAAAMDDIVAGKIDLDRLGQASQTWVERVHGSQAVLRGLRAILGDFVRPEVASSLVRDQTQPAPQPRLYLA